jgi:hypothetical protein
MERTMAQFTIPDDTLRIFVACEATYADANRKGYSDYPDVIRAVANLRSVYKAFVIANGNLMVSKGPFDKTIAGLRADRACGAFRTACVKLQATIERAALEDRLYNRCIALSKSTVAHDEGPDVLDFSFPRYKLAERGRLSFMDCLRLTSACLISIK